MSNTTNNTGDFLGAIPIIGGIAQGIYNATAGQHNAKQAAIRDRQFAREMFAKEQDAALQAWNRTNEYNSPVQQMQRLREAGLNPNLIYGKGAENVATLMKSSTGKAARETPFKPNLDVNLLQPFLQFAQLKQINAQTDNIYQQNALIRNQAQKVAVETANIDWNRLRSQNFYDLEYKQREWQNLKIKTDIAFTLDENERKNLANTWNTRLTMQQIAESKMNVLHKKYQNAKTQAETKKIGMDIKYLNQLIQVTQDKHAFNILEYELRKDGLTYNDPYYIKMASIAAGRINKVVGQDKPSFRKEGYKPFGFNSNNRFGAINKF